MQLYSSLTRTPGQLRPELKQALSWIILGLGGVTLIATSSPQDIPSVDRALKVELEAEEERVNFGVIYEGGPVNFIDYPLVISLKVKHIDPSETFAFEQQSWSLITESLDGAESRRLVVVEQGVGKRFVVDQEERSVSGVVNLNACTTSEDTLEEPLCIPCDATAERCEFTFALLRSGAPYPREEIELELSQWTTEGASFELDVIQRGVTE